MTVSEIVDRLNARMTTPYDTTEDSNINKLAHVSATPMDEVSDVIADIISSHHLSDATGCSLDRWGVLLQVVRTASETDSHYRARLSTQLLIYRRSATPQDMISSCADVLGVDSSRLVFSDGAAAASFGIAAYLSDIAAAGLSLNEYSDIMNAAKAAGVFMTLTARGSFACMGIGGASDNTKGYNNIANSNPDGGRYAGTI